ncbi:MAG: hypothetical protein GJV46_06325 [Geobacter sp.]|nr:hypothetical protein [Geobacter sp.]
MKKTGKAVQMDLLPYQVQIAALLGQNSCFLPCSIRYCGYKFIQMEIPNQRQERTPCLNIFQESSPSLTAG